MRVKRVHTSPRCAAEAASLMLCGHAAGVNVVSNVPVDEFARLFAQRAPQLAWLLGAGASAAAGVPTGWDLIGEFKKRLYCAATNTSPREVDLGDPLWSERVNLHFDDTSGFPPTGHPSEYAVAFEAAYPRARDRRAFIEDVIKQATPSFAHRILGALISSGRTRCVLTTNFDDLVERATVPTGELVTPDKRSPLTVGALDTVDRADRCVAEGAWPLLVKLHGDYQSERLMNTDGELRCQDERLRCVMARALGQFGLFVVGYSGRDDSVMDVLDEVIGAGGALPAGLWWAVRPGAEAFPRVAALLERAEQAGIEAGFVTIENFDELAAHIEHAVVLEEPLRKHVLALRPKPLVTPVSVPKSSGTTFPIVRCSALELLELPSEAREVTVDESLTSAEARELVKQAGIRATVASVGRHVLAFGADDDIKRAFTPVGGRLAGIAQLDPGANSTHRGLIYDALVRAVTRRQPLAARLRSRGHRLVVQPPSSELREDIARARHRLLQPLQKAYQSPLTGTVPQLGCAFTEFVQMRIEQHDGRWWLVFEPRTWVDLADGSDALQLQDGRGDVGRSRGTSPEVQFAAADWRRERWAQRYNAQWNQLIAAWSTLIAPHQEAHKDAVLSAHYFEGDGVNATFRISGVSGWSDSNSHVQTGAV